MERRVVKSRGRGLAGNFAEVGKSYLNLIEELPLRPIGGGREYERAAAMVHRLAMREEELDSDEEAYLVVLEMLVERYDREHCPMDTEGTTPTDALRMLVAQAGMSVSELGRMLGSKGAASELLSGRRKEPSKAQIARLCERFKVDAGLFLLKRRRRAVAA